MKKIIILLLFACINLFSENNDFWMPLNVPEGGTVYELLASNNNTLYARGWYDVYRSTNQGDSWELINKTKVSNLAINSKNVIFATERYEKSNFYHPHLIVSSDNGITWDTIHSVWEGIDLNKKPMEFTLQDLKIGSDDRIYILIREGGSSLIKEMKILTSDDDGISWYQIDSSYYNIRRELKIFPYKDGHFILMRSIIDENNQPKQVFSITTDNGQSYHDIPEFQEPIQIFYINEQEIIALYPYSIQYTNDGGLTWSEKQNLYSFYEYNSSMFIGDNNELYVITNHLRLLHSTDMGNTWSQVFIDTNSFLGNKLPILIQDSLKNIYFTHGLGFDKSTDRGKTFHRKSKGFIQLPAQLRFLRLSFDKKGNVYFCYDGVYISRDNGISWEQHSFGGRRIYQMLVLNDGSIIAYPNRNTVYRSTDEGRNWDTINTDNTIGDVRYVFSSRVQAPSGTIFVTTASYSGVFRSRDGGLTYQYIGGQGNLTGGKGIAINNQGHIFSFNNDWIHRSTDDGDTWEPVYDFHDHPGNAPHVSNYQYRGIFHPSQPIGYISVEIDSYPRGTVKTTDNGETWFFDSYHGIAAMAVDSLHNIILNLSRSADYGESWEEIDSGINTTFNFPIEMGVSSRGYIFTATEYGGIYRSRKAIVSVRDGSDKPNEDILLVAPNPFSEKTDIQYYISHSTKVKLSVHDIFGREVICLVDNQEQYGHQTITLDGNNLPNGIYLLILQAEGVTKSVMLMKYR